MGGGGQTDFCHTGSPAGVNTAPHQDLVPSQPHGAVWLQRNLPIAYQKGRVRVSVLLNTYIYQGFTYLCLHVCAQKTPQNVIKVIK